MKKRSEWQALIAKYQLEQLTDAEFSELEEALRTSEEARALFHQFARIDSGLRRESEQAKTTTDDKRKLVILPQRPILGGLAAAAAVLILSALTFTIAAQKRIVATLVSTEDAAWQSDLPTVEGSSLTRGSLRLVEGIATVRFASGIEFTLEAPTRLFLKGPSRASLVHGTIIGKADGEDEFMLETPRGQVVIREGEFVASSKKERGKCRFEVISGDAYVSHDSSREAVKIETGETAVLSADGIKSSNYDDEPEPIESFNRGLRLLSEDRTTTFIRNNKTHKWTRPEFLTLKKSISGNGFDQYSVVSFDLSEIETDEIESAVFRLNFVPSGQGLVSLLPKVNQFSVYGLMNPEKEGWSHTDPWENAPSPADGRLVGTFELPRSQQEGVVEVAGAELLDLIRTRSGKSVTFIVIRNTARLEGIGRSYIHAIASSSHPETVGPTLELFLK